MDYFFLTGPKRFRKNIEKGLGTQKRYLLKTKPPAFGGRAFLSLIKQNYFK
jgi:hypothetical protein